MSFWQIFRIIFVIFSLYLLGDAIYRWDGFRYHSSFSEFLPAFALTSILWSLIALLTTILFSLLSILIYLSIRASEWLWRHVMQKSRVEQLHLFIIIFLSMGTAVWVGKRLFIDFKASWQLKVSVLLCTTTVVSIFFTWLLRHKAYIWVDAVVKLMRKCNIFIQERITPLVWLFGIWVAMSVPLAYHMGFKDTNQEKPQEFIEYPVKNKNQPNIVLLTFDALTARDMSLYGYSVPTTPFISKWAKDAYVFDRVEAAGNFTSPTTASLMTGKRVWSHLRFIRMASARPIRTKIESLPLFLKKHGYYTMAFIANPMASVKNLGVSAFFDIKPPPGSLWKITNVSTALEAFLGSVLGEKMKLSDWLLQDDFILSKFFGWFQKDMVTQYPPEIAFREFIEFLDNTAQEPYFVWIHVNPPHSPYLPPEPYRGMFDPSSPIKTYKDWASLWNNANEFKQRDDIKTLRTRYDEFIRYCDKQFEEFIMNLEKRNILRNTAILVSSDHGEIFDHNSISHGSTLYESETHIPLIIRLPDQVAGKFFHDLVEQVDIPATILDLAGIQVPSWMEGYSLLPLLRGDRVKTKPAFSMILEKNEQGHSIKKGTIAIWEGDYKLIHNLEKGESFLFNIKKDPDELNNLFDKEKEKGKHLVELIQENLNKANETIMRRKLSNIGHK